MPLKQEKGFLMLDSMNRNNSPLFFLYIFNLLLILSCSIENKSSFSSSLKIITDEGNSFSIDEPLGTLKLSAIDKLNSKCVKGTWSVNDLSIAEINSKTGLLKAKRNGKVKVSLFVSPSSRISKEIVISHQLIPIANNIVLHPDLNAVSITIDRADLEAINKGEFDLRKLTHPIYNLFEDDFDFIFLISHNYGCPECPYAGRNTLVKNDIKGIGKPLYNSCEKFGSQGKLQSIIHITQSRGMTNGTALHELMHRWGNYVLPSYSFDSQGSQKRDYSHWGVSSANGVLGGFELNKKDTRIMNAFKANFRKNPYFSTYHNHTKYSPIELYLMGMIPKEEVPPLTVYSGIKCNPEVFKKTGLFSSDSTSTYTINDIIRRHGERIPSYHSSQKTFKALAVILSTTSNPIRKNEWVFYTEEISKFCASENNENYLNFYQATGKRAELTMGELDESLRKVSEVSSR